MDKIFLDTNVVLDFLQNRHPFVAAANEIFKRSLINQTELFISALSICNVAYIIRKTVSPNIKQILTELESLVKVLPIDSNIINLALASPFKDFEDAVQYYCAFQMKSISTIITRNESDFIHSKIRVLSPEKYLLENPI